MQEITRAEREKDQLTLYSRADGETDGREAACVVVGGGIWGTAGGEGAAQGVLCG